MDDRLAVITKKLEAGKLAPGQFQIEVKRILDAVGDEAQMKTSGDTVKLDRIELAARKASAL